LAAQTRFCSGLHAKNARFAWSSSAVALLLFGESLPLTPPGVQNPEKSLRGFEPNGMAVAAPLPLKGAHIPG